MTTFHKHQSIMNSLSFFIDSLIRKNLLSKTVGSQFLMEMENALAILENEVRLSVVEELKRKQ